MERMLAEAFPHVNVAACVRAGFTLQLPQAAAVTERQHEQK
jgi:hypothetical protein